MKRVVLFLMLSLLAVPAARSADMFDRLDETISSANPKARVNIQTKTSAGMQKKVRVSQQKDHAELLTLEPGETEMYPKVSHNGRMFFATIRKRGQSWISYRYAENGDPANIITDDARALDSIRWKDSDHVYFLSKRTGGLGLWEKAADGRGLLRRLKAVTGNYTQTLLLPGGDMIAVRLTSSGKKKTSARTSRDAFNNWTFDRHRPEIVRIGANGYEQVLAGGVNPALSPDGKRIVFSMPIGRSMHLFVMAVDGSDMLQLTDERSIDVQPAWSPDGKQIVFTSNRAMPNMRGKKKGNWDIWAIDRQGRNLTRLTRDEERDGGASIDANGRVYFHSDRKINKDELAEHQMRRAQRGFHIWTVQLPR